MPDLLLELRSEEIPARMQRKAAGDLKAMVTNALVEAGLTYEGCREYWTPRRLALDIRGLVARSRDVREERKGPRTDAPRQALEGFVRAAGLASLDEAHIRTDPKKGDFYVAVISRPGRPAQEIIAECIPAVIRSFPWPKSMRWGPSSRKPGSLRWVRPLQSILCTFGPETEEPEVIDFEVDGIVSGNVTWGHRFHAPAPITVRRFDDYVARLEAARVVLDAERRKHVIRDDATNLAFASGLELVEDEGLLEEVSGLVEYPVVLMGTFEEAFLDIPPEVVRLTIRANQKCFVTRSRGEDDRLSNHFVLVSNIEARDGGRAIAHGNAKVVRARLSDAHYFWQTDQKDLPDLDRLAASAVRFALDLTRPLDQRMARLDHLGVTFHARLGTQGDRVARLCRLARELAPAAGADPALASRAAALAKADLQTEIVGEFPELQGVMGAKYALLQGEHASVAAAIEGHYKPQGPADSVPSDPVSIAVALAEKLDTLVGFWAIGEKPTGSKDPYALRRAALGVIRILVENAMRLPLAEVAGRALALYREQAAGRDAAFASDHQAHADGDSAPLADLLGFLHERLKVYLREQGARHDLIDAVLASRGGAGPGMANDDLLMILHRVQALSSLLDSQEGQDLLAGTKRAANILSIEEKKKTAIAANVEPGLLTEAQERRLLAAIDEAELRAAQAIGQDDYAGAMKALAALREPVDSFFDAVLVNDEDAAVRANRLALLARIRDATGRVADFSRIIG